MQKDVSFLKMSGSLLLTKCCSECKHLLTKSIEEISASEQCRKKEFQATCMYTYDSLVQYRTSWFKSGLGALAQVENVIFVRTCTAKIQ